MHAVVDAGAPSPYGGINLTITAVDNNPDSDTRSSTNQRDPGS